MHRSTPIIWITLLLSSVAGFTSCNANSFKSAPTRGKADSDGRRPSEQGEGITGYLREPGNLEYQQQDGMIRVRGSENAVATSDGRSPAGLAICLQTIEKQSLIDRMSQNARFEGADFETLAESTVNSDGSFLLETAKGKPIDDRILTINATGQCSNGGTTNVTAPNQIVFMSADNEGSFFDVAEINAVEKNKEPPDAVGADGAVICSPKNAEKCDNIQVKATDRINGNTIDRELIVNFYPPGSTCIPQAEEEKSCNPLDSISIRSGDYIRIYYGEYLFVIYSENYQPWPGNIPESISEGVLHADMTPTPQADSTNTDNTTDTSTM